MAGRAASSLSSPALARGWSSRALLKAWFDAVVVRLPDRVRAALAREVARTATDYEAFQALGRAYGVSDIRVAGACGAIVGSINDNGVLRAYAVNKTWAHAGNRLFIEFFEGRGGGTYIDVGANIGLTTIPIAQNPAVSCKAFEPAPENFRYLEGNLAANCPRGNVQAFNIALFDRPATLAFELSDENLGDHRIRIEGAGGSLGEGERAVIPVVADRLDTVLDPAALHAPIAVKISTQGAEVQVVAGARRCLEQAEVVALEFWPYGIARAKGDVGFLVDFIVANFQLGAIIAGSSDEDPDWMPITLTGATLMTLFERHRDAPYSYRDLFVRKQ